MADLDLTTTASVPSGTSITITVYEDSDDDGGAENQASQAIDDGTNTYTLSGFAGSGSYWIEAEFDSSDITKTAELDSAALIGAGGQVCDLTGLIEDKRAQISTLRTEVEQTIGDGVVPDEFFDPRFFREDSTIGSLDEEAEAFINDLEDRQSELGGTDCSNYQEALERLIAAEDVSIAAAEGPNRGVPIHKNGESTIIRETARFTVESALILGTVSVFRIAKAAKRLPRASRLISRSVDEIAAISRSIRNTLLDSLPPRLARMIDGAFFEAKNRFREIFLKHQSTMVDAFQTAIVEGGGKVLEAILPNELLEVLGKAYNGAVSLISKILYEHYVFSTDIIDAEIPAPRSIAQLLESRDLPDMESEISLDDERIEFLHKVVFDDEIDIKGTLDISLLSDEIPKEFNVDLPLLSQLDRIEQLKEAINNVVQPLTLAGIDPSIDNGVDYLEATIAGGSLGEQEEFDRETAKSLLAGGIKDLTTAVEVVFTKLSIGSYRVDISLITLVLAAMVVVIAGLSFPAILAALPYLAQAIVFFDLIGVLIVTLGLFTGGGYLYIMHKIHAFSSGLIIFSDNYGGVI